MRVSYIYMIIHVSIVTNHIFEFSRSLHHDWAKSLVFSNTHRIHGTGVFTYISYKHQLFMDC